MKKSLYEKIEEALSVVIPQVFKEYLECDNIIDTDNNIYSVEDILERNLTDEVSVYAPGYLIIGDDSGDNRYIMKSGEKESAVYISDCGDLNPENFDLVTDDFSLWYNNGFPSVEEQEIQYCKVILKNLPNDLLSVARIKKEFNLSIKSSDLLSQAKNGIVVLKDNITFALAMSYMRRLEDISEFLEIQLYRE